MYQDLVDFVSDLRSRGRSTTDLVREFEKDKRGDYISFASFRAVICKVVDRSYSDNTKAPLVLKLIQPFEEKVVKGDNKDYRFNYKLFSVRVDQIHGGLLLVEALFDKIFRAMKDGRNTLFKKLGAETKDDSGLVITQRFKDIFMKEAHIDLKEEDIEAVSEIYGIVDQIDVKKLEAEFKKWFAQHKRTENLETITNQDYVKDVNKKIFVNFYAYFKRYGILEPKNYFKEYNAMPDPNQMNPGNYLLSRYCFKEAVYNIMPQLPEDQYMRFELAIEPNKFEKMSTNRFTAEFERVKKDITPGEVEILESYNPIVIHIYYKICETLLQSGKDLRKELMSGDYGFENVVNYIKSKNFIIFLRNIGLSIEEFNIEELNFAFKAGSEDFYTLTDLLTYFDKMRSPDSHSILDKLNSNFREILDEFYQHVIKNQIPVFMKMLEKDKDRDGILIRTDFDNVITGLLGAPFDAEVMSYIMPRYAEYRDDRINILAFLYDLYMMHLSAKEKMGNFFDFQNFEPGTQNQVMTRFANVMQSRNLSAEHIASELVDHCKSHRITISAIMLKVIKVLEDDLFGFGNSPTASAAPGNKHPLARIFEVADHIDQLKRGNIMDYDLVSFLNSFLRFEMRTVIESIITKLTSQKIDLTTYLADSTDKNDIVNGSTFQQFLMNKEGFKPGGVDPLIEKLGLDKGRSLHISKVQIAFERQLVQLRVLENIEQIKAHVYGSAASHINAEQLGVAHIVDDIHKRMYQLNRNFDEVFGGFNIQNIPQYEFLKSLGSLGVSSSPERTRLLEICKDKRDEKMISAYTFRQLYNSRVLSKDGESAKGSGESLNQTIKNLKETVKNLGPNLASLFSKADSNSSNTLDQRVAFSNIGTFLPAVLDGRDDNPTRVQLDLRNA